MASDELAGVVLDGRYRVIERVAAGAMGVVYRAERTNLGRIVAVKLLHHSVPNGLCSRQRFEIEALAMAKLEHPHCAAVLDVGMHGDRPFVVMDFFDGERLEDLIAKGPVTVPRAIEIMRQILSGLSHAHELGIVHRDIKPANIVLMQKAGLGDQLKILDFGLARLEQHTGADLTAGMAIGTPSYMAPEQIRAMPLDQRADVYACGVLLFELLTGVTPFRSDRDDPIEIVTKQMAMPPPRLDDLRPGTSFGELEDIVSRALAKAPEDRYASAAELAAALEGARLRFRLLGSADTVVHAGAPPMRSPAALQSAALTGPRAFTAPAQRSITPAPARATRPPSPYGSSESRDIRRMLQATIPVTPRRVVIAGATAVIVLIAVLLRGATTGSAHPAQDTEALGARTAEPAPAAMDANPASEVIARADELAAAGRRRAALDLLVQARRDFPDAASIPYFAGRLYFEKLWWIDGLESFRTAIRIEPAYGSDPELIKIVLRGFATTPRTNHHLARFIRDEIGAAARPFLEEIERDHPNPIVRTRASAELRRLRDHPRP